MKKLILLSLLLCLWLGVKAQNIVSLSSVSGNPYSEVEVSVSLQNSDDITAFELSIPLTNMTKYVEGSATLSADRSNGHAISADARDNKLTILIYSMALTPLNGSEGELCSFKLRLGREPANYTLTPEVILGDASGNSIAGSAESGVVTILTPKIEVVTSAIDYGSVPIRSTYNKTLTIKNVGTESLEITNIAFDRTDISASQTAITIAPQTSQNITLIYSPMERGDIECNVTITSNAINSTEGKAVVTAQPFSVNELHVQRVQGISDDEVTVVLKMNNMEPIVAAQCNFTMPDQLVYVEGSAMAGSRCSGTDHVAYGIMQDKKLTLMLYSPTNSALPEGDGEYITFKVKLNGTSGSYRLNPTDVVLSNVNMENMTSATTGNYVVIQSPKFSGNNSLSFGSTPVTEKAVATYSIYNNNAYVNLEISSVAFLAEGYAVETPLPLIIAPRKTQTLTVTYTPTVEGDHSTTMQIYTNDPLNRMKSVALSGSVFEPNTLAIGGENSKDGYDVSVSLDNYTDIVAVQMNINWLQGMKTANGAMTVSERLKNHSYLVTDAGNGTYQILIYSMSNTPITGNSGELFTLSYTADEGVEYKDSEISINSIVLSDASGKNYNSLNEVKANATFSNYTLKFEVEDAIVKEEFLKAGSTISAPEVEPREGYTFSWSDYPATMPNNDLTVIGTYSINSYKVIVSSKEGGVATTSADEAEYNSSVILTATPNEGYRFINWTVNGVEISTQNPYTATITSDSEFVANFLADKKVTTNETLDSDLTLGEVNVAPEFDKNVMLNIDSHILKSESLVINVDENGNSPQISIGEGGKLTAKNIKVVKSVKGGVWTLLSLPFDVDISDITVEGEQAAIDVNIQIRIYDSAYRATHSKEGNTANGWKEKRLGMIPANQGFAVAINSRYEGDIQEVVFNGYNFTMDNENKQLILQRYHSSVNEGKDADWNFMGNPSLCNQEKNGHYSIYIYNSENDSYSEYSGSQEVSYLPFSAWFIQSADDFTSMMFTSKSADIKSVSDNIDGEVTLVLNDNDDKATILLNKEASYSYQRNEDALYMASPNTALSQLYIVDETTLMAVSEQPSIEEEVLIGYKAVNAGEQTITLASLPENYSTIELIDTYTDEKYIMEVGDVYNFTSDTGTFNNRLKLHITDVTGIVNSQSDTFVKIIVDDDMINIYGTEEREQILVYSANGMFVNKVEATKGITSFKTLVNGVIIIKLGDQVFKVLK